MDSEVWFAECRKRLTASTVGSIAKMRATTKRAKRVESLLYSKFRGNTATHYGQVMEDRAKLRYQTYQRQHGHPGLIVESCGLHVSVDKPWLAASPDDLVTNFDGSIQEIFFLPEKEQGQWFINIANWTQLLLSNSNATLLHRTTVV